MTEETSNTGTAAVAADGGDGGWYSAETATFGDRLAGAREVLGLSQSDLSKKLGVKLKTIHAWEEDLAEPRANKLQMMAGILNVSLMWLLTGEGDGLSAPSDESDMPETTAAVLTEMRKLKAELSRMADRLGTLEKRLRSAAQG